MEGLVQKKCRPCEGGVSKLNENEARSLQRETPEWKLSAERIVREFRFKNFKEAVGFINRLADVAEGEGHHPDFTLYGFRNLRVELWTHAVGGLTENDFIVAAKIDRL